MVPVPNLITRLVDGMGKLLPGPWNSFFQQFTQAPPSPIAIVVGTSPFTYTAKEPGVIAIAGGTITGVALIRGTFNIGLGSNVFLVPVGTNDSVVISYSGLPAIRFLPTYGQNLNA